MVDATCAESAHNVKVALQRCQALQADDDDQCMHNQHLLKAARAGDTWGLRQALAKGAFVETRKPLVCREGVGHDPDGGVRRGPTGPEGLTPLMHVIQSGSSSGVEVLLEAKASVHAVDEDGWRPLHFAAAAGDFEICRLLVEHDAEVGVIDEEGRLPLHCVPKEFMNSAADRRIWEWILSPADTEELAEPAGHGDEPELAPVPPAASEVDGKEFVARDAHSASCPVAVSKDQTEHPAAQPTDEHPSAQHTDEHPSAQSPNRAAPTLATPILVPLHAQNGRQAA